MKAKARIKRVEAVIAKCGGVVKVADILGITHSEVSQWHDHIPIESAMLLLLYCEQNGIEAEEVDFIPSLYEKAQKLGIWPNSEA